MGKGQTKSDIALLSPYPLSFWDHQAPSPLSSKTPLAQSAGALWEGRRNKREMREHVVSRPSLAKLLSLLRSGLVFLTFVEVGRAGRCQGLRLSLPFASTSVALKQEVTWELRRENKVLDSSSQLSSGPRWGAKRLVPSPLRSMCHRLKLVWPWSPWSTTAPKSNSFFLSSSSWLEIASLTIRLEKVTDLWNSFPLAYA